MKEFIKFIIEQFQLTVVCITRFTTHEFDSKILLGSRKFPIQKKWCYE